ncbi:MAG: hypothetical protein JNK78_03665 [Planctomycetes bacterium]|nr:hypothetical protein [Planctomycetota bacterium]
MRTLLLLGIAGATTSCTLTMAEPHVLVSPYLAVHQLRGDAAMQSAPTPGTVQDNARETLRTFGQDHYREDFGIRVDIGDGFGGFRADYYQLDQDTTRNGVLAGDFGRLLAGDAVQMKAEMDEIRIGYVEPIVNWKASVRERPVVFQLGIGAVVAHRNATLRGRTTDGVRQQRIDMDGDTVYPAARARVSWRDFAIDAEYAISPDLSLGGDFEGTLQDLELRLSYSMPMRDVSFFAGWRYSELPAEGNNDGFRYDADLILDGFVIGASLTF